MLDRPADLVFLDCETLGLDPAAPIWEFAAVRREVDGDFVCNTKAELLIEHDPGRWLDDPEYPQWLIDDYEKRFDAERAVPEARAAEIIASYVDDGAVVLASNPGFDMERIALLLQRNGFEPGWHYHPIDVPTLVQGYLAALHRLPERPWKSDTLSAAVGVDPADYARHTALGDVLWTVAQYDVVMDTVGGAA